MNMSTATNNTNFQSKNENKEIEWPYYKGNKDTLKDYMPLLIMEIHRLQPFYDNIRPRLQVLNRPELQIRNATIIGIVRKTYSRSRLDLMVDDGTGRMQVLFEWDKINKLKEERKKIDLKFQRLSKIAEIKNSGPEEIQNLEKRWMQETNNGKLGVDYQVLDYVKVTGFIVLDYGQRKVSKKDVSLEKGYLCKPIIHAGNIQHQTEKEYNDQMQNWILGKIKSRYVKEK
ncbi:uncharacterized protein LOC122512759 [Leptopilina heterotoma]|uniref:uncharacterized protein LOC122512759 n=1 Tax=Leptopilina heterotoma TaxID=63436 RepID=UPI001CAA2A51|nr:uncharacterized protein LOC122512759 [Leptopilina heterotoma]